MKKIFHFFWTPFIIYAGIFIGIKIHSLGIRASDTNIYWYTAKELLSGKILYKDVFFTNLPLVPYLASFYFIISKGNLLFYYFTPAIESVLTAAILYYLAYKQSSSKIIATITGGLYLFSFMLLSTSDHQTGVFLAGLLITASYLFYTQKRFLFVGIFTALALLTKAYTLPFFLSYFCYLTITNKKQLVPFFIGFLSIIFIVLLPSFIFAPKGIITDIFKYSLQRSQGISKLDIIYFFIQHDFLFFILIFTALFSYRKEKLLSLFSVFSLAFFLLYKDVYYLYLNVTIPLLCASLPSLIEKLEKRFSINRFMFPTVLSFFIFYNLLTYFSSYDSLQKLPMADLSQALSSQKTSIIYGVNGIAPALAYTNNFSLLNNIVDTNDNIFRKGYLSATTRCNSDPRCLVSRTGSDSRCDD